MIKLKRLFILILSLTFTVFLSVGVLCVNSFNVKGATNETKTTMFMPASRLEFYELNSPQAICYQDGYLIISEYHKDPITNVETNKLIVYNPTKDSYEVNLSPTLINVTCVAKYENYLLLLIDSAIFTLPLNNLTGTPTDTGIRVGKSFSVNKNAVVTNTSSGIYKYNMVDDGTALKFTKIDENFVTGVLSCLLASNGDFYYFVSGTGLIQRKPDGGETIIYNSVPELDIAPSYMAEIGNFVYFTTPSGLYKVEKKENSELIKIIPVSTDGGLGSFNAPAGITVKDGKLLVADTSLNCIQEIDPSTDYFTQFAVTTESTADYRLTNDATNLSLSENYVYALDDATVDDTAKRKRIVKISLDKTNKTYEKIDLSSVYAENPNVTDILYCASDTHVLIADGEKVNLYEQVSGKPITLNKVFSYDKRATAVYYLDGDFYFTNYYIDVYNANAAFTQIYKIQLPTTDNELNKITLSTITVNESNLDFSKAITGYPIDMTVDIFGNVYVVTKNSELSPTEYKIHRYYGSTAVSTNVITEKPLGIETDFAGNVYALFTSNAIKKYSFNNVITTEDFTVNTGGLAIKDLTLNYRSNVSYFLSNACILTTTDDVLGVQNLSRISADSVKPKELQQTQQFITVDKNAKLFKVTIGDYIIDGGKKYFKTIEPISNPNTERIYLIIADVDNDYYLISYSNKFTALVKKSSVQVNSSTSLVPPENYQILGIKVQMLNNETRIVSNDVKLFSRPIFDENYETTTITKSTAVLMKKVVTFNDKTFILVADSNDVLLGYLPNGYLVEEILTTTTTETSTKNTVFDNGERRVRNVLMVMIIAFTLTATALLLEYKLLFKKGD